jgi:hypothetical protein
MAIQIETNTQSREEVEGAFIAHGMKPVLVEEKKAPAAKPAAVVEKPSEPVEEPGDATVPAETAGEGTAAEVKDPTQETDPAPTQVVPKPKSKGGFQAKLDKATAKIDNLQEELDSERGDKTRIAEKLTAAQAELEALRGGETKPAAKDAGPVRPKAPVMPDLADFDFDQDKYKAALKTFRSDQEKYEGELDAYYEAMASKKANEAVATAEANAKKARDEQAAMESQNAFVALKDRDAATYGEEAWAELLENEPKWESYSTVLPGLIMDSEIPGHLMMYLYENPDELERISGMTDRLGQKHLLRQATAIGRIEDKLVAELKSKSNGAPAKEPKPVAAAAAVAATEAPPAKPAKPRAETPDAPIKPVGARMTGGGAVDYNALLEAAAKAGDGKEYRRLRALQHAEQAKKAR